jgi:hypothetical protein
MTLKQLVTALVKWCCAHPGKPIRSAGPPSPVAGAPPPPEPPPAESGYRAAIVEKGYQATWNAKNRAPPATTKTLLAEVALGHALPSGWSYDAPSKILYIGACDESEWDLRGVGLYHQDATSAILRNSRIGRVPQLDYAVRNGADNGGVASVLELHGCEIDGKGTGGPSSWSTINSSPGATFRTYDCNWIDADYRFFSGVGEFYRDYFGKAGLNTAPGAHVEQLFLRGSILEDCFLDARGSGAPAASGNIQTEAGHHIYRRVIMIGCADLGAYVAVQGSGGASFLCIGGVVEPGLSSVNSPTGGYVAANGATSTASGNLSYAAAADIDPLLIA